MLQTWEYQLLIQSLTKGATSCPKFGQREPIDFTDRTEKMKDKVDVDRI